MTVPAAVPTAAGGHTDHPGGFWRPYDRRGPKPFILFFQKIQFGRWAVQIFVVAAPGHCSPRFDPGSAAAVGPKPLSLPFQQCNLVAGLLKSLLWPPPGAPRCVLGHCLDSLTLLRRADPHYPRGGGKCCQNFIFDFGPENGMCYQKTFFYSGPLPVKSLLWPPPGAPRCALGHCLDRPTLLRRADPYYPRGGGKCCQNFIFDFGPVNWIFSKNSFHLLL